MSKIQRSLRIIQGDLTINNGDVKVTDPANGVILEDDVGDRCRIRVIDDSGVKTILVEELPYA